MKRTIEQLAKKYGYTNLFLQPKDTKEVQNFLENFGGDDKVTATTIAGVLQNYYAMELAKVEFEAQKQSRAIKSIVNQLENLKDDAETIVLDLEEIL